MLPTTEELLQMYRWMVLTREFDQGVCEVHARSPLPELPHASVGQEAIGVGVCFRLRRGDVILPSLRTRAAFLVKGVPTRVLMAGVFARATGPSGGLNTSHHLGDLDLGIMAGSGVIGSHLPLATGAALAARLQKRDDVAVAFFGDGGSNRGDFHESLNLAAILKLPVLFLCENNLYAMSTAASYHLPIANVADRAAGYGMPGVVVDGNDVIAVDRVTTEAVARARRGEGPTLIECKTYRWRGHSEKDATDLRPPEEVASWKARCPIARLRRLLLEDLRVEESRVSALETSARQEVEDALRFAQESPFPAPGISVEKVFAPAKGE